MILIFNSWGGTAMRLEREHRWDEAPATKRRAGAEGARSRHDDAVLAALRATTTHPTAAELYDAVRLTHPRIGRATVYRALQRLEAAGLAAEVARDSFGRHYDARVDRHDHAVCCACGRVLDVLTPATLPDAVLAPLVQAARAHGIAVTSYEIRLYGRCAACRDAASGTAQPEQLTSRAAKAPGGVGGYTYE
jgi:Fe2+ or Zn2+ uptake regulation protein